MVFIPILERYEIPYDFSQMFNVLNKHEKYANSHTSYCHGDLTFDNVIFNKDRIILIDPNYKNNMWQSCLLDIAKLLQESDKYELREEIMRCYSKRYGRQNGELKFIKSLELTHYVRMWPYILHKEAILYDKKSKISQLLNEIKYNPNLSLF